LTIANGVLLAGFDENFVSERFLRRSYGILWERAVEQLRDPGTPHRVEVCPFDKCDIARDMAKWLLRRVGDLVVAALDLCLSQNSFRAKKSNENSHQHYLTITGPPKRAGLGEEYPLNDGMTRSN
jgi:hypothetical protein